MPYQTLSIRSLLATFLLLFFTTRLLQARTIITGGSGYRNSLQNNKNGNRKLLPPPPTRSPSSANDSDLDWEYWGPHGEHHWEKSFKSCKGKSQSPIDIVRDRIVYLADLQLSFINYDRELAHLKMTNNGHTIKLEVSELTGKRFQCFTTGSAFFGNTYRFSQLHFHWRNAHSAGSEHAIDGEKFSMEMHLVHQNVKYDREPDTEMVLRQSDAFTVIAVFFNETNLHNFALEPIIDHLDAVANPHQSVILEEPLRLDSLLPPVEEWSRFYRYSGSYTTPGCQEVVTWIVFPTPLHIDALQMQKFREIIFHVVHSNESLFFPSMAGLPIGKKKSASMLTRFNEQLLGFYRHIQELGNRRIYAPEEMMPAEAGKVEPVVVVLVGGLIGGLLFSHF